MSSPSVKWCSEPPNVSSVSLGCDRQLLPGLLLPALCQLRGMVSPVCPAAAWGTLSCRPHPQLFSPDLPGKFDITQTPLRIAWFGVGNTPDGCHWCLTGINPHSWLVPRNMQGGTVLAGSLPAPACLPTLWHLTGSAQSAAGTLCPANSTEAPLFHGLQSGSSLCSRAVSALTQH